MKQVQCALREAEVRRTLLLEEVREQQFEVLHALAQRRQLDGEHRHAVEQVLAEAPRAHLLHEVAVGGAHEAEVARDAALAADAGDALVLQRAQELGLDLQRQLADLVQEERASVGLLDLSGTGDHGPRERALLVAEQLALHQVGRQGGAVQLHERAPAARAEVVDGARHEVLARAALAVDEHGQVALPHLLNQPQHGAHGVAVRHDAGEHVAHHLVLQVALELPRALAFAAQLRKAVHVQAQGALAHGLRDEVVRTGLDGHARELFRVLLRDDEDADLGKPAAQLAGKGKAVLLAHVHVHDGDVRHGGGQMRARVVEVQGGQHLQLPTGQQVGEGPERPLLVVHNEDGERKGAVVWDVHVHDRDDVSRTEPHSSTK